MLIVGSLLQLYLVECLLFITGAVLTATQTKRRLQREVLTVLPGSRH